MPPNVLIFQISYLLNLRLFRNQNLKSWKSHHDYKTVLELCGHLGALTACVYGVVHALVDGHNPVLHNGEHIRSASSYSGQFL